MLPGTSRGTVGSSAHASGGTLASTRSSAGASLGNVRSLTGTSWAGTFRDNVVSTVISSAVTLLCQWGGNPEVLEGQQVDHPLQG